MQDAEKMLAVFAALKPNEARLVKAMLGAIMQSYAIDHMQKGRGLDRDETVRCLRWATRIWAPDDAPDGYSLDYVDACVAVAEAGIFLGTFAEYLQQGIEAVGDSHEGTRIAVAMRHLADAAERVGE